MEKVKNKYEVILGFVTLVISLSAFKQELAEIRLNLGYITITLADYFLYSVYGLCVCLYLYILEKVASETKIGSWKIFNILIWGAFIIFTSILLLPFLLIINIACAKAYTLYYKEISETGKAILGSVGILSYLFQFLIVLRIGNSIFKSKKELREEIILDEEIIELEKATKYLETEFYSHSILESYKALESHLFRKLIEKNPRFNKNNLSSSLIKSLQYGLISKEDFVKINDLKKMRNLSVHSDFKHTKEDAEKALKLVVDVLKK
ncbi:hypothetical protein OA93_06355 [Flavobacterium sp. KMS]|nr:hypothetical protein OA93_06355 [Flavobacterium sp. KMS]